jgi:hypothetical protein
MYGERIEHLANPISATDAVNKQYVDSIATDLSNIVDNKITIDGISSDNVDIKHIA